MGRFVVPETYFIGYQEINDAEIQRYLRDSGNEDFWLSISEAREKGVSNAEILCSMFAKLCYKSLTLGQNANVTRIRDIQENLRSIQDSAHGSIFEHVNINFITANCSRVFTHELVRHRVGCAYSQNSGRYIRLDSIDIVLDPILDPIRELCQEKQAFDEAWYAKAVEAIGLDGMKNFDEKKKVTSALRRFAPNGQANEIAFFMNLRTLRHIIMLRTNRHAEWEIRLVFSQVYRLLKAKYPLMFSEAKETIYNGIVEVSGLKMQPYEKTASVMLDELTDQELEMELVRRKSS